MSSTVPFETSSEQYRQRLFFRATHLAGKNSGDTESLSTEDEGFVALIRKCEKQAAKSKAEKNASEIREWNELIKKIQHMRDNAAPAVVTITQYPGPKERREPQPGSQLTIGDTHGNALKLIYFLIRQGVLELEKGEEDYKKLIEIYKNFAPNQHDLRKFDDILARATLKEGASLRLIGDEVGDRGANDYFNLKVIQLLNKGNKQSPGVPLEILFSDHGAEFIDFYEKGCPPNYAAPHLKDGQARSVENLSKLVSDGLISAKELQELIRDNYIPNLKAISYTIDEDNRHITLYSHAPIGLETVKALAEKFGISYNNASPRILAQTIDKINEKFNELAREKRISGYLKHEDEIWVNEIREAATNAEGIVDKEKLSAIYKKQHGPSGAGYTAPLTRIIWSRYKADPKKELEQEAKKRAEYAFMIRYVHGHDNEGYVPDACFHYVKNLDDKLAKDPRGDRDTNETGLFRIHCNFEMSARQFKRHLESEKKRSSEIGDVSTVSTKPKVTPTFTEGSSGERKVLGDQEVLPPKSSAAIPKVEGRKRDAEAVAPIIIPTITPSLIPPEFRPDKPMPEAEAGPEWALGLQPKLGLEPKSEAGPEVRPEDGPKPNPEVLPRYETAQEESRRERQPIIAEGEVTADAVQASFQRILTNIEDAQKHPEKNSLYHNVIIESADPKDLRIKIETDPSQKPVKITRKVTGTKVTSTLSRHAEDQTFLLFCDVNRECSPLSMTKPCRDDTLILPLKILEAAIIQGIEISLSSEDKEKFLGLDQNDPRKKHYDLLQKNPEEFLDKIKTMEKRPLGEPLTDQPMPRLSGPWV